MSRVGRMVTTIMDDTCTTTTTTTTAVGIPDVGSDDGIFIYSSIRILISGGSHDRWYCG